MPLHSYCKVLQHDFRLCVCSFEINFSFSYFLQQASASASVSSSNIIIFPTMKTKMQAATNFSNGFYSKYFHYKLKGSSSSSNWTQLLTDWSCCMAHTYAVQPPAAWYVAKHSGLKGEMFGNSYAVRNSKLGILKAKPWVAQKFVLLPCWSSSQSVSKISTCRLIFKNCSP